MGDDRRARKVHKGHAAVKDDPGSVEILAEVEFPLVRPVVTVAAQPDDDNVVNDGRIDQTLAGKKLVV